MVFSSLPFLFVFLPAFLLLYAVTPQKLKNLALFAGSVAFYAYGAWETPGYILLLLAAIFVNWLVGRQLSPRLHHRKAWLVFGLLYDFLWLFVFKYAGFFFDNLSPLWNALFHQNISRTWELILPIGISFYTFQIVSYLVDVYRGVVPPERSFINLGAYLCMFPQLVAGPIVQYNQVAASLRCRKITLAAVDHGARTFALGLGSKVLLANRIGSLWDDVNAIGFESLSTPLAWLAIAAFSLQIYFDFYGYSLMAIGLGEMMGFSLPENFRDPYQALSMTDFWRRWHITLGSWFREYVYIPLGGNRCGRWKTVRNLLIVWLLTGFWHGASWNFILWGLLFFVLLTVERFGLRSALERHPLLGHLYMLPLIPLSWSLFAITDFRQLKAFWLRLFPFGSSAAGAFAGDFAKYLSIYGVIMAVGLLFCTPLPRRVWNKLKATPLAVVILLAIFWGSVWCLFQGLNDPFLYFRF